MKSEFNNIILIKNYIILLINKMDIDKIINKLRNNYDRNKNYYESLFLVGICSHDSRHFWLSKTLFISKSGPTTESLGFTWFSNCHCTCWSVCSYWA